MTRACCSTAASATCWTTAATETLSYGTVTPIVPATLWDVPTGGPDQGPVSAAGTIIANSGQRPTRWSWERGAHGIPEQRQRPRSAEQAALGHGRHPADRSARGRTAQFIGRLFRPYVSLYGYSEDLRGRGDNSLKQMVDPKLVLIGCSKSPATHQLRRVTQVEQNGETRATRTSSSSRESSRPRKRIAPSFGSYRGRAWSPTTWRHGQ